MRGWSFAALSPHLVAWLALVVCAVWPRVAEAHPLGLSRGAYTLAGGEVKVTLVFAERELATACWALDANTDGELTTEELALPGAGQSLEQCVLDPIRVDADARRCRLRLDRAERFEDDALRVEATAACAPTGSLVVRFSLADNLGPDHRHLARVVIADRTEDATLTVRAPELRVSLGEGAPAAAASDAPPPLPVPSFLAMVWIGVEHILFGFDHLVFLLGLILVGGTWRSLLAVVTAFTVGHSLTLALATLGVWAPSPTLIEPAIALSIAYVGVENFFVKDARKRWRITLPFGLVHGFGFAGALAEIALPRAGIASSLLAFNLGVEAGQIAVMAPLLPLVRWASRRAWFDKHMVKGLSGLIVAAGLYWFLTRIF